MKTLLLVKNIYLDGFKNIINLIAGKYFKDLAVFGFIMFVVVLYAFIFRAITVFTFN